MKFVLLEILEDEWYGGPIFFSAIGFYENEPDNIRLEIGGMPINGDQDMICRLEFDIVTKMYNRLVWWQSTAPRPLKPLTLKKGTARYYGPHLKDGYFFLTEDS